MTIRSHALEDCLEENSIYDKLIDYEENKVFIAICTTKYNLTFFNLI